MFFKNQRGEAVRECTGDPGVPARVADGESKMEREAPASEGPEAEEDALKLAGL